MLVRLIGGLAAALLMLGVAGCQVLPIGQAAASGAGAGHASNQVVIWGEVPATPDCPCDHPDYLGRVSRGLAEVHLDQAFAKQNVKGQWQLFTVTYTPGTVPTEKVVQIIKDRGGKVVSVSDPTAKP